MTYLNTFSIVAHDPKEQAWGVAVASKFLAAAALVSWAQAGAGAIATQSLARVGYGPRGLAMLSDGTSAADTLAALLANDPDSDQRQVGIVDAQGRVAAHTGDACNHWAGHHTGNGFCCQGNILAGEMVLGAMATAYQTAKGELADRLLAALQAGERAGGDRRGKQSAGLLVVRPNGGYGGDTDRYLDLRVDDAPDPVAKLGALLQMHHLYFGTPRAEDKLPITPEIARELQTMLIEQDYMQGDADGTWDEITRMAFWELVGTENLEVRWNLDGDTDKIDRVALQHLRQRFGSDS